MNLYKITYRNIESGNRETYMNNSGFPYELAVHEVFLLKQYQSQLDGRGLIKSRDYFKIKQIKQKK